MRKQNIYISNKAARSLGSPASRARRNKSLKLKSRIKSADSARSISTRRVL